MEQNLIVRKIPISRVQEVTNVVVLIIGLYMLYKGRFLLLRNDILLSPIIGILSTFGILFILYAFMSLHHTINILLSKRTLSIGNNSIVITRNRHIEFEIPLDEIKIVKLFLKNKRILLQIVTSNSCPVLFELCELYYLSPFQMPVVLKYNYLKVIYIFYGLSILHTKFDKESLNEITAHLKLSYPWP